MIPRHGAHVAHVVHPDYAVVLNLATLESNPSPYRLDGIAALIWQLVDGTRTAEQVAEAVVDAVVGNAADVRAGVAEYLGQLRQLGLVEDAAP